VSQDFAVSVVPRGALILREWSIRESVFMSGIIRKCSEDILAVDYLSLDENKTFVGIQGLEMNSVEFVQGDTPLLISIPHMGTRIPESISAGMTRAGMSIPDTDWHLDRLYDFAEGLGAHIIKPCYSRYVVDLNRVPGGEDLYPGLKTTTLVPLHTFTGEPIYHRGKEPSELATLSSMPKREVRRD